MCGGSFDNESKPTELIQIGIDLPVRPLSCGEKAVWEKGAFFRPTERTFGWEYLSAGVDEGLTLGEEVKRLEEASEGLKKQKRKPENQTR